MRGTEKFTGRKQKTIGERSRCRRALEKLANTEPIALRVRRGRLSTMFAPAVVTFLWRLYPAHDPWVPTMFQSEV
jgi:hypothetical protein